jgi:hypothetical protein
VGLLCHAQQGQPFTPVRYHLGDDAHWADPNLDDSSWSVAPDGRVPEPSADTNGFVWSRVRVVVPPSEIAHAAQVFGQADDITVLTLAFVPVPAGLHQLA